MNDSLLAELTREGTVLADKYRVERQIGQGGMGIVVAATHLQLGQIVALKFLLPDVSANPESVRRFVREARAAATIQGEHIVRVSDVGTLTSGIPYIVMEHLKGSDLAHLLATRGPLPIEEAVDYVLQTCEALAEAHAVGLVHRDIKPSNLFLTRRSDGSPLLKVLDFGISKAMNPLQDAASLTLTRDIVGSPQYMSPEQIRSARSVDARTDVWSVGVVLYELLTDALVYEADTVSAQLAMIAADPPPPLRDKRADVPRALETVVLRCLEKDRERRFADVAELARALAPFGGAGGPSAAERVQRILGASATPELGASSNRWEPPLTPEARQLPTVAAWGSTAASSGLRTRLLIIVGVVLTMLIVIAATSGRWMASRAPATSAGAPPSAEATLASLPRTTSAAAPVSSGPLEERPPQISSTATSAPLPSASVAPPSSSRPRRPRGARASKPSQDWRDVFSDPE